MSGATVTRWLARGRLHRIHPGVYALGHRCLSPRGRLVAALLYAGPGAALCGRSAAAWIGLVKSVLLVEVETPHRRRCVPGVRVQFRRDIYRVLHRGLPVTSIPQTLLDLARVLSARELRRAIAETDHLGLLTPAEVTAICGRGRAGSAALRRALAEYLPELVHTRSELEERFLELCERSGVHPPELNVRVAGFTVDAIWREHRVAVELDGAATHGRPAAVPRDRERELALRELGYCVLRYSWRQIVDAPARVVADLRRALHSEETQFVTTPRSRIA